MSINRVCLSGNLTRQAELKTTGSGTSVTTFGLAVSDRRKARSGEWEDYTHFVDCTIWGRRAEALTSYLSKGMKVAVEGKLNYHSWQDKETGKTRSKLDVVVDEIELMTSRGDGQQRQQQSRQQPAQAYSDADIPF